MSAYFTTHHFSPRLSTARNSHEDGDKPRPPPMTPTTITAPTVAPRNLSTATTEPTSPHRHLSRDALTHFLHAFNLRYDSEDHATHHEVVRPHFDLVESKTAYAIYGELAGLGKQDVSVDVNDHLFTITISGRLQRPSPPGVAGAEGTAAEDPVGVVHGDAATRGGEEVGKTEEVGQQAEDAPGATEKPDDLHWHVTERRVGRFRRAFQFPVELVDMGAVGATMHNGLLCVLVPKKMGRRSEGEDRKVLVS